MKNLNFRISGRIWSSHRNSLKKTLNEFREESQNKSQDITPGVIQGRYFKGILEIIPAGNFGVMRGRVAECIPREKSCPGKISVRILESVPGRCEGGKTGVPTSGGIF